MRGALGVSLRFGLGHTAVLAAMWRDGDGRLVVLPPCGRCREFLRQVDPGNLDTRVVLGPDRVVPLRDLLPAHVWPAPLDEGLLDEGLLDEGLLDEGLLDEGPLTPGG